MRFLEQFLQDLRYAVRVLRKNRGFAATAVLTLALGIGATTALFSVLEALLLRSLPAQNAEHLVRLFDADRDAFGYPPFDQLRRSGGVLAGVLASDTNQRPRRIEEAGIARFVSLQLVSGAYFDVLGVRPWRGRVFHDADDAGADGAAAVISESYWRQRYGGDSSAIGQSFRYANRDFTIVGVAPPHFRGIVLDAAADIWIPFAQTMPPDSPLWTRGRWLHVMARTHRGVTSAQVEAEASAVLGRTIRAEPGSTGFSRLRGRLARPLVVLQCVVVLVLLIACANLANLMLARAASRTREIAVRQAVGASRGRLMRQLLTETLVLSVVGGTLALVVAQWVSASLLSFLPPDSASALPNLRFHPSVRVLVFSAVLSLTTCVLFGLAPSFRATRASSSAASRIREDAARAERRWTSRALMICEVALCLFLLIGAGLFVRSLRNVLAVDAGFDAAQVLVADVELPPEYPQSRRMQTFRDLAERAAGLPDVRAAGFSQVGQMSGFGIEGTIHVKGQLRQEEKVPTAFEQRVSPRFLASMGTELRAGRDFDSRDTASSSAVAIVNEAFVRAFLVAGQPLGQRFGTDGPQSSGDIEIVGVVEDSKWLDLREMPRPMYYRPFEQRPAPSATLVVRTTGRLQPVINAIPGIAQATDRRVVLKNIAPFSDVVNRTLAKERMVAYVSAAFGALALLIVCLGLFGLLAYGVARRTREIGVRMALGATRSAVLWMVLRESLVMLAVGLPLGIAAAVAGSRFVASMLYGLTPLDLSTITGAVALLTLVSLAAAYVPARRATQVDPLLALRAE